MAISIGNLNRMKCGLGNIGCTYEEIQALTGLLNPIIVAIPAVDAPPDTVARHPMPADADDRMEKAEAMFTAIQAENRLGNLRSPYL